ncbi:MAG: 4Fe-4S dicluster domain-containing protein [Candidatus Hydrothermarchaeales archaeon]
MELERDTVRLEDCNPNFIDEVAAAGGENIYSCFQCGTCTGSCPVAYVMDYPPRTLMRMIQLGMRDEVLSSATIWTCASCNTCITRCPRGVRIPEIMGALKGIAIKEGIKPGYPKGPIFYTEFNDELKKYGLLPEMMLSLKFAFKAFGISPSLIKNLLKDAPMGLAMFTHGKLTIRPHKVKNIDKIKTIYESSLKAGG